MVISVWVSWVRAGSRQECVLPRALGVSLGIHGLFALLLAVAASRSIRSSESVEEITSGAWAGSLLEVGMTSEGPEVSGSPTDASTEPTAPTEPTAALESAANTPPVEHGEEASTAPVGAPERAQAKDSTASPLPRNTPSRPPVAAAPVRRNAPSSGAPTAGAEPASGSGDLPSSGPIGLGGDEASTRRGQFPAAFTRALPAAARGDSAWHALAPGRLGRWIVRAELDETGALTTLEVVSGDEPYLRRLLRVTQTLLRAGRFALSPSAEQKGARGEQRLGLQIEIEQIGSADRDQEGEPHHVRQLSSTYPTTNEPGEALVTFHSGRRVRLLVFLDPR